MDVELTDKGKLDAQNAGKLIKQENINFKTFFTSFQKRAINTLEIVLKELNNKNPQIIKAWELNERHYGALSSLSKDEMTRKHGIQKVKIWRRSWDIAPPPMEKDDPNHPSKHQSYKDIPIMIKK